MKYLYSLEVTEFSRHEALGEAAAKGHLDIVRYLLEQGVDVNTLEGQALINAAWNGHLPMVKFLLLQGANLHAQEDSAIADAIEREELGVIMYLLPLLTPEGRERAMTLAVEAGDRRIVEFFTDNYPELHRSSEAIAEYHRDKLLVAEHILPTNTLTNMVASYY